MIVTITLTQYLDETGETPEQFAERSKLGIATVRRLLKGVTTPNSKTGKRILSATGNRVTPNNFFGLNTLIVPDGGAVDA